jgi:hypothetical protein
VGGVNRSRFSPDETEAGMLGVSSLRSILKPAVHLRSLLVGPLALEPRTCGLRVWCERAGQRSREGSELGVSVAVILIVSHRFLFLHGDGTGDGSTKNRHIY